jgi:hypothetical protein
MCEQSIPRTLNEILQGLESPLQEVLPLPIAHLTTVTSFENIVNNGGELIPSMCNVFNRELLYFSYGGVFHRHRQEPTSNLLIFPVALLFSPRLLTRINCFFPYDTGAAHNRIYDSWSDELSDFERYIIPNNDEQYTLPSKLVYYTYGSNQQYLKGKAVSNGQSMLQQEPLITLLNFLGADLNRYNVDHRQHSIECQTSNLISLQMIFDDILWIGLPKEVQCVEQFDKLCRLVNPIRRPPHYFYDTFENDSCYAIARTLQAKAREDILEPRYLKFGI